MTEYLVTAQGYEKTDIYKQSILLHETFFAKNSEEAKKMFYDKLNSNYKIIKIYSSIPLSETNV